MPNLENIFTSENRKAKNGMYQNNYGLVPPQKGKHASYLLLAVYKYTQVKCVIWILTGIYRKVVHFQ